MRFRLVSLVTSFFLFTATATFASPGISSFLEGQSPLRAMGSAVQYVDISTATRQVTLFSSATQGASWTANSISPNSFEEGTGSFAESGQGNLLALFLINKDFNPSLYLSQDKGVTWAQQSLVGFPYHFSANHYVSLTIDPRSSELYLYVYDFSQDQLNVVTTILTSPDGGLTWSVFLPANLPEKSFILSATGSSSFMRTSYGLKNYYDTTTKLFSHEIWLSSDRGLSFAKQQNTGIPTNSILFTISLDPQNPSIAYLIALLPNDTTQVLQSSDKGKTWKTLVDEATLGGGKFLDLQVSPANSKVLFLYAEEKRFVSTDGGITFTPIALPANDITGFFFLDGASESVVYSMNMATQKVRRSADYGTTWADITPRFEAAWVSQTQGTGSLEATDLKPLVGKAGNPITVQSTFRNTGNVIWDKEGYLKVGFFVYKDVNFSGPQEYNNPTNKDLFGKSWFADPSWGASADGSVPNARASLLLEDHVLPGAIGTFAFTFAVPQTATVSPVKDVWETIFDDRYIREDLTLAWGPNWMDNVTNGDPIKRAHVWFPVQIQ